MSFESVCFLAPGGASGVDRRSCSRLHVVLDLVIRQSAGCCRHCCVWGVVVCVRPSCKHRSLPILALQAGEPRSFAELENELLKGQKLQGVLTSDEVQVGWCSCVTGREGPQDTQAPAGQQPDMHA